MFVNKEGKGFTIEAIVTTERKRGGMNDWSLMRNK